MKCCHIIRDFRFDIHGKYIPIVCLPCYYHHTRFNTYANTLFLWLCFDSLMFCRMPLVIMLLVAWWWSWRHGLSCGPDTQTLTHGYTFYRRHDRRDNAVLCIVSLRESNNVK